MSTTFTRGENPLRADKLNTAFSERINRSGDTMTGMLTLASDPGAPFHAATKQYVDYRLANQPLPSGTLPIMDSVATIGTSITYARADHIHPSDTSRVAKVGDTMTGGLSFGSASVANGDITRHLALFANNYGLGVSTNRLNIVTGSSTVLMVNTSDIATVNNQGITINAGNVTLTGNPSLALQATPKQYVDSPAANPLPYNRSGATWVLGTANTNISADQAFDLNTISGTGAGPYTGYIGWHRITNQTAGLNFPPGVVTAGVWTGYSANAGWDFQLCMSGGLWYRWMTTQGNYNAWSQVVLASGATMTGALALAGVSTAPTATAGTNTTQIATTAFVQTAVVAPALGNVGRNLLHNGLFNVAQRGTGPWNTSVYTVDRWLIIPSLDTMTVSPPALSDTDRAGIGDEAATYCLSCAFTGNAGAASFSILQQHIENVRRLGGKTVTVSFSAVASVAGIKLGISADQNFGSGGSPSAAVPGNGQAVTLTTAWARYSVTLVLPSVSGKTLGTNGDSKTTLNVWYSCGTTNAARAGNIGVQSGTVNFWGVQLEIGSVATPLEKPDPRYDLANCQRFYQIGQIKVLGWSGGSTGVILGNMQPFPVIMRATPTMTPTFSAQVACAGSVTPLADGSGFYALATGNTANAQLNMQGTFTASADL